MRLEQQSSPFGKLGAQVKHPKGTFMTAFAKDGLSLSSNRLDKLQSC